MSLFIFNYSIFKNLSMKKIYFSQSSSKTKKIGEGLANKLLQGRLRKRALVIGLEGDLGGGKTTFLQGFAKGLRIKEKILSPTFIILKKFKIRNSKFENFYHIDCYRIQKPKEILDLGIKEIIQKPKNIVAIEWAEKIQKILPSKIIKIKFKYINKKTRKLTIQSGGFNL